jgi:hypothetical protein
VTDLAKDTRPENGLCLDDGPPGSYLINSGPEVGLWEVSSDPPQESIGAYSQCPTVALLLDQATKQTSARIYRPDRIRDY